MPVSCKDLVKALEDIAPIHLAEKWDNVGLQIGDINKMVKKVLICLDLTKEVLLEAINNNVDMIVAHHPLIFKPLKKIDYNEPISNIIVSLIKNDISLYCAHTNLDIATGGTSDYIGKLLNLNNLTPLRTTYIEKHYKLVVYTPETHLQLLVNSLSKSGAGSIGNYSHCTFQSKGTGTFKPLNGSTPYIGEENKLERVEEVKLETIVSSKKLYATINTMIKEHPYEEVAYDIIPLENKFEEFGFGRVGLLNKPVTLKELAVYVKDILDAQGVKLIGENNKMIKKIAICTGSGADFINDALKNQCDCYITGDVKYHEAQYALDNGIFIIDAGHFETENVICKPLKKYLEANLQKENKELQIIISKINTNPFQILV